jgi:hypothetical protein
LLGALLALPTPAAAQHTQLSVFGGVATDQLGQRSNAVGVAPTLTFAPSANLSTQLAGNATRFATDAWSLGGSLSFAGREPMGSRFALTLRGDANASRLRGAGSGTYAQGELSPGLELNVSRATLFGGARLIGGSASQQARIPGPGLFGPTTQTTQVSRSGGGALYGVAMTLMDDGSTSMAVSAREERASVAGLAFTDRTAAFALVRGGISISASAGIRRASDERDTFGGASLILPLASTTSLEIAGGRYASNRVLGTPAGQFMSVGLSLRFGRERETALPRAEDVPAPGRGMTRLTIRAPNARTVEVAGDFTMWKPVPARRAPNGVWYADLRVPPGRYRYAFRVNGAEWRVPDGATAVDDGFGGKSAWLSVGEGRAK